MGGEVPLPSGVGRGSYGALSRGGSFVGVPSRVGDSPHSSGLHQPPPGRDQAQSDGIASLLVASASSSSLNGIAGQQQ